MGGVFSGPSAPAADPEAEAAARAEEARAKAERLRILQSQLAEETTARTRLSGRQSLLTRGARGFGNVRSLLGRRG
jgi:hypothetical protein